jgi:hypothetical protein
MAEEPVQSDEEDGDYEEDAEEDDQDTVISEMTNTGDEVNNQSLEGLRLLFRRVSNDIEAAQDVEEEDEDDDDVIPKSPQEIADLLVQKGYTMTDMVKAFVIINGYYFGNEHGTRNQQEEFMEKIDEHMRVFLDEADADEEEQTQQVETQIQVEAQVQEQIQEQVQTQELVRDVEVEVEPLPKLSLHFKMINNVWKLWNPQDHLLDADSKNPRKEVEECL